MNNSNDILATKRAWSKSEQRKEDRRKNIGSVENRKLVADCLKASRHTPYKHQNYCTCASCEIEREHHHEKRMDKLWWIIVGIIITSLLLLLCGKAHAETASWYGTTEDYTDNWVHVTTADGKPFNENALTAASWDYTLGSIIRVTNLENGKEVIVRITDRGPSKNLYRKGRTLDLTRGAFSKIADLKKGIIKVKVYTLFVGY